MPYRKIEIDCHGQATMIFYQQNENLCCMKVQQIETQHLQPQISVTTISQSCVIDINEVHHLLSYYGETHTHSFAKVYNWNLMGTL